MSKIMICLISEQSIPNLIGIKQLSHQDDKLIFISTKKMEDAKKSNNIAYSLEINDDIERIIVDESSLTDINEKLNNRFKHNNTNYIVNITCGTKLMSMAVFDFFKSNFPDKTEFIYIPINKNYIQYFNEDRTKENITTSINLVEYLKAYGITITDHNNNPDDSCFDVFEKYKKCNFNNSIKTWKDYSNNDQYKNGAWFEDYCYFNLKKKYSLQDNQIMCSVKIAIDPKKKDLNNEIDVVFVKNNELYVIECKYSLGNSNYVKENLERAIHKLSAISKTFGIKTNSYIMTLSNPTPFFNTIEKSKNYGIKKIIGFSHYRNNCFFNLD